MPQKEIFSSFLKRKGADWHGGNVGKEKIPLDGWQVGTVLAVTRELILGRKKVALFSEK